MSIFIQRSNGSIRRVSHTFGGSTAWRQHIEGNYQYNDSCTKLLKEPDFRSRMLVAIDEQLAADDLRDLLVVGPQGKTVLRPVSVLMDKPRRSRHRKSRFEARFPTHTSSDMFMAPSMVSTPVVVAKPKRAPFRVIISPTGKMIAVPLESEDQVEQQLAA